MRGTKREKETNQVQIEDVILYRCRCIACERRSVVGKDGGKEIRKKTHWVASVEINVVLASRQM